MEQSYIYFIEKSSSLVRKLMIGTGTARERLLECEMEIILTMSISVPEHLEVKRDKISKEVNKKPALIADRVVQITAFHRTVISMRNTTASKIIASIYDLYEQVKWYQEDCRG